MQGGILVKKRKKYEKPKIVMKRFLVEDIISQSGGTANSIYIGGHEYRY